MKRFFFTCIVMIMALVSTSLIPTSASSNVISNGQCGTNVFWLLDDAGVMTISGYGDMKNFTMDFSNGNSDIPWAPYINNITEIYIENGVTSISPYAFNGASILKKVIISDTVKTIGDSAFNYADNLEYVIIGDGVETIGKMAFFFAEIDSLYLGKNVRYIGENAFNSNTVSFHASPHTTIRNLFYPGTREQWDAITIEKGNALIDEYGRNRVYYNFDDRYKTNISKDCKIKIGDYMKFGNLNSVTPGESQSVGGKTHEPIIWRVININENKVTLFSQDPVEKGKPFDVGGVDPVYHNTASREEFGSNNWKDSTLRQWLNSDESNVSWTHCPPVMNYKFSYDGINQNNDGYDDYPGFLSDAFFTEFERSCIKETTNYFVDTEDGDYITKDKVFLLSEFEVSFLADRVHDLRLADGEFPSNLTMYWLRESIRPKYTYVDVWEKGVHTDRDYYVGLGNHTEVSSNTGASSRGNVRPAMVVDISKLSFNQGDGTRNNPYTYIKVNLNGSPIIFDQSPIISNDRTLVPVRAIFESLGASVEWNGETNTVTSSKNGITVSLTIGENIMYKNKKEIPLDCAPQIVNSRTLIPVRAVSEAFGCKVDWDDVSKTVNIVSDIR